MDLIQTGCRAGSSPAACEKAASTLAAFAYQLFERLILRQAQDEEFAKPSS